MYRDNYVVKEGNFNQIGANVYGNDVVFTFECDKEKSCALRLYDAKGEKFTDYEVSPDFCMGAVRSVAVENCKPDEVTYNFVIDGKEIVDPFATSIRGRENWGVLHNKVRGAISTKEFDWQGDNFPELNISQMIMYKLHVRGFTKDAGTKVKNKGTLKGVLEQLDYLKSLGVTVVELMPVYEFEETLVDEVSDFSGWNPQAKEGYELNKKEAKTTINYWGYGAGNYYAVKTSYGRKDADTELKELVREFHKNGIEVVMEMSFPDNANPNFCVSILRHWVKNYHIDGFHILSQSLAIEALAEDIYLKRTKIFYHSYPEFIWNKDYSYRHIYVYNDDFLYVVRKQINHIDGNTVDFLNALRRNHEKIGFVNYAANNNGFTLADVFSYAFKHNEENGENNSDGNDWNYSVNLGVEGNTKRSAIIKQRTAHMMITMASTILSSGIPLIYAGDEFGNSQSGNNNAYCQDNKTGWVNWKTLEKNREYADFVKQIIAIRKKYPQINSGDIMRMEDYKGLGLPDLSYHDIHPWTCQLFPSMMMIGLLINGAYVNKNQDIYIGFNFSGAKTSLALVSSEDKSPWRDEFTGEVISEERVIADAYSVVVLVRDKVEPVVTVAKKTDKKKAKKKA